MVKSNNRTKIEVMREGGNKLSAIRKKLVNLSHGESDLAIIDKEAELMIKKAGGRPSFKMVPNYEWSTCINVNSGIVHGIPKGKIYDGDIVSIDMGFYYQGYHTDAAISFVRGKANNKNRKFLKIGKRALLKGIRQARPGNRIEHISRAIQSEIERGGYNVVRDLTGHGVGRQLHEEPIIACFVSNQPEMKVRIKVGMSLAIEVMYTKGDWPLVIDRDGWTMRTEDGSLAGMFEETVFIGENGAEILTN